MIVCLLLFFIIRQNAALGKIRNNLFFSKISRCFHLNCRHSFKETKSDFFFCLYQNDSWKNMQQYSLLMAKIYRFCIDMKTIIHWMNIRAQSLLTSKGRRPRDETFPHDLRHVSFDQVTATHMGWKRNKHVITLKNSCKKGNASLYQQQVDQFERRIQLLVLFHLWPFLTYK